MKLNGFKTCHLGKVIRDWPTKSDKTYLILGTSFLNRQSAYFATFSWSIFDAFQISGFFTPKTANESSSIVAKSCLDANIDRHSTPKQVSKLLQESVNGQENWEIIFYSDHRLASWTIEKTDSLTIWIIGAKLYEFTNSNWNYSPP